MTHVLSSLSCLCTAQAVIDSGMVPTLVGMLDAGSTPLDVVKEVGWAISNGTSGGSEEQARLRRLPPL